MLDGSLKIVKLIFMRNLEELWVICCDIQREIEVFPLLILCKTKPTHDRNALKGEIIGNERIDVRAHVAL